MHISFSVLELTDKFLLDLKSFNKSGLMPYESMEIYDEEEVAQNLETLEHDVSEYKYILELVAKNEPDTNSPDYADWENLYEEAEEAVSIAVYSLNSYKSMLE